MPGRNKKIESRCGEKENLACPIEGVSAPDVCCAILVWHVITLYFYSYAKNQQRMPLFPPKEAAYCSMLREQCDRKRLRSEGLEEEKEVSLRENRASSAEKQNTMPETSSHGGKEHRGNLLLEVSVLQLQGV